MSPTSYQTAPPRAAPPRYQRRPDLRPARGRCPLWNDVLMDIIDRYAQAATGFTARLDAVTDDQWANPTPCTDWNVRELVDHVIDVQRAIPEGLGVSVDDGAGAREKWNRVRAAAVEALRQPGVLERTMPRRGAQVPV